MEAKELLKQKQDEQQKLVDEANALSREIETLQQKHQAIVNEILRLDGAIRALTELGAPDVH